MSIKSSGLWCDLCCKPILDDPYWDIGINGKAGHSCYKCAVEYGKKGKLEQTPTTESNREGDENEN